MPFASFLIMARLPRVVVVDVVHHITQRGNARQIIFADDADRLVYLDLRRELGQLYRLDGSCLGRRLLLLSSR